MYNTRFESNQKQLTKLTEGTSVMNSHISNIEKDITLVKQALTTLDKNFKTHIEHNYNLREQYINLIKQNITATTIPILKVKNKDKNVVLSSINDILLDTKICGICYSEMSSQIFNCTEGHIICKDCHNKVNKCPYCKNNNIVRNRILEQLLTATKTQIK